MSSIFLEDSLHDRVRFIFYHMLSPYAAHLSRNQSPFASEISDQMPKTKLLLGSPAIFINVWTKMAHQFITAIKR
jgi:hypothetical protein